MKLTAIIGPPSRVSQTLDSPRYPTAPGGRFVFAAGGGDQALAIF